MSFLTLNQDGWIAQGSLPATEFGRECSGIVTRCATDVTAFTPGDRVAVIGQGTFTTHYVAPSHCCRKIPDSLSFEVRSVLESVGEYG